MRAALFLLAAAAWGQTLTVTLPGRATAGQTIGGSVLFSSPVDVAAVQWTLPPVAVASGAQPVIPNKSLVCASSRICMVLGVSPAPVNGVLDPGSVFNFLPIGAGAVQNFSVTIPASALPGDVIPVQLSAVFAASPVGSAVTVVPVAASVLVVDGSDLNQDGVINLADAQMSLARWLAAAIFANFQTITKLWPKLP